MNIQQLVTNRVSKGFNEIESKELLDELLANHTGDNLESALRYQSFTK